MVRGQLERELQTLESDLLRMQQELEQAELTCMVNDEFKELKKLNKQVRFIIIMILKYSVNH